MLARPRAIPCITCSYDITGLPLGAICPECATPLKTTLEASKFLRGSAPGLVKRYRLAAWLLAMSPTSIPAGFALGLWIGVIWAAVDQGSNFWTGMLVGVSAGCGASCLCGAIGAELITRSTPARPLRPDWARFSLRYGAILAAIVWCFLLVYVWAGSGVFFLDSALARLGPQLLSIVTLAGLVRVSESVLRQTQRSLVDSPRIWLSWIVVGAMTLVWCFGAALSIAARPGPLRMITVDWGAVFMLLGFLLNAPMLWRVVDAVSLEGAIAEYARNLEATRKEQVNDKPTIGR